MKDKLLLALARFIISFVRGYHVSKNPIRRKVAEEGKVEINEN